MEVYAFSLKKERTGAYHLMARLILAVNLVYFLMMTIYTTLPVWIWSLGTGTGIMLVWTAVSRSRIPAWRPLWMPLLLLIIVTIHFLTGLWWAAIIMLLLAFLYRLAIRDLVVKVSASHIDYPSFPRKNISWNELNNLVLKDGLLTVDFRNNRLAQVEVIAAVSGSGNWSESGFNQFCRTQLTASRNKIPGNS